MQDWFLSSLGSIPLHYDLLFYFSSGKNLHFAMEEPEEVFLLRVTLRVTFPAE